MFQSIKKDLPNFPDQVVRDWIQPFAEDEGWPPITERWKYLLKEMNLERWRKVTWDLEERDFTKLSLSSECMFSLQEMLRAYINDEDNVYKRDLGERGKERFHVQLHYLIDNGALSSPPVLVDHGDGLEIMDGNHRVAALCAWYQWKDNPVFTAKLGREAAVLKERQPVWIGKFTT